MKKIIVFLLLGAMLIFNAIAYAQAENTAENSIGGADKATDIQVNNNIKRWVLINIPAHSLRLYDNDKCIEMYPVGVGKIETKTPVGFYKVMEKIVNPTWTDPADVSLVIPSGEDNPLGYRWIGIGGNYGIHGTNKPSSVGHYVSNGCVRMVEADVEKVFDKVDVGTEVQIIYNRLVIDKTFDGRVAYYIYPDGYNMQNLTVDFVKQGLKGYGIADFITDEAVEKSIELSNGQPNYVAGPVNIIFNGNKLPYKAVNYKNLIYVPVKALATTLNTPITMDNNLVKTQKGEADISLYSNVAYMRLTDIANIFDYDYSLNKNLTEMTLKKINESSAITTENTNTQVKEIVVPKKQTDEKINLDGTVIEDTKQNINTVKQDNTKEKVDTKNSNSDVKSK
ncbi:L,D-transpeptidase [uncultured Megamonas sp.]|uniref:L,D-transpeptidase n=1 Tax=uncultured Megamonas sp. TaxID=286140 RepID=UPI002670686D|nr:L,D-transpeptidase [uncultured Megamonas sp.]